MKVVKYVIAIAVILGGLNALRLRQAEDEWKSFASSCEKGCMTGLDAETCATFCECMRVEIETRYPTPSERHDYLREIANEHRESGQIPQGTQELAKVCAARMQS